MGKVIYPLKPICDCDSQILILGSFPSVISRKQNFYYANPNNRFWKVMSIVFEDDIHDRKQFCLNHHIALWDVIKSCSIKGSSDSSIENVEVNDISSLLTNTNIHTIITTGKKAEYLYRQYINLDINYLPLPSTSSANARMSLDNLLNQYQVIKQILK